MLAPDLRFDRAAVLSATAVILATVGLFLMAGLKLSLGASHWAEYLAIAGCVAGIVGVLRIGLGQWRGSAQLKIDDRGITQRGDLVAWSEVVSVSSPEFGVLEIQTGARILRLRTLWFSQRAAIEKFVMDHGPKEPRGPA